MWGARVSLAALVALLALLQQGSDSSVSSASGKINLGELLRKELELTKNHLEEAHSFFELFRKEDCLNGYIVMHHYFLGYIINYQPVVEKINQLTQQYPMNTHSSPILVAKILKVLIDLYETAISTNLSSREKAFAKISADFADWKETKLKPLNLHSVDRWEYLSKLLKDCQT